MWTLTSIHWTVKKTEHQRMMLLNCGVGEDSESPLDCKEIGRNDAKAETPVLWPPHVKS